MSRRRPPRPPMPWQPNFMALAMYLFPGVMGALYAFDLTTARGLSVLAGAGWADLWTLMLIAASGIAVGAAVASRTRVAALYLEALGALILALQIGAYGVSVSVCTPTLPATTCGARPWFTIAFCACFALGCLLRAVQAVRERARAAATQIIAAQVQRQLDDIDERSAGG